MNIEVVNYDRLRPASWRANYILKPELNRLALSLREDGWMYPVLARSEDSTIIDGFARWLCAQGKEISGEVPVRWISCEEIDAMILHVRVNDSRGQIVPGYLSRLLRKIDRIGKYSLDELQRRVGLDDDTFDLLMDGSLIKSRRLAEHKYSAAWVPVEAPSPGAVLAGEMAFERPPDADG